MRGGSALRRARHVACVLGLDRAARRRPVTQRTQHLLLWDGDCSFCRRAVVWVQRRDRRGEFDAVPYQLAPSPPMTPELARACARAVHVLTADGRVLRAGRASLFVLEKLGWGRWARVLAWPPFVWLVELGYWYVARHRRWFSRVLFRHG